VPMQGMTGEGGGLFLLAGFFGPGNEAGKKGDTEITEDHGVHGEDFLARSAPETFFSVVLVSWKCAKKGEGRRGSNHAGPWRGEPVWYSD
jgi:hypothetical protein